MQRISVFGHKRMAALKRFESFHTKETFRRLLVIGLVLSFPLIARANDASPTAYEVMYKLRTAVEQECASNGPSCKAFTDVQQQLGAYIEARCRALALTSVECAQSPLDALLNQSNPQVMRPADDEHS